MRRMLILAGLLAAVAGRSAAQVPMPPGPPGIPTTPQPPMTFPPDAGGPTPGGAFPGPTPRTDPDRSVQFPSSFRQPPPPDALGQPLSAPFDWNMFRLGGQFRINGNANNYPFHPNALLPDQPHRAFVNQRYRLWLTYSPTEHVEGYVQMQVGGINWGTNYDFNKNFGATFPTFGGDRVGIELRRAWMAYKDEGLGKVRVGFLDWHDSFHDTLASADYDFNVAGVDWVKTVSGLNNLRLSAAVLLLSDQAFATTNPPVNNPGRSAAVLYALDVDQPITDRLSVGGSAYLLDDQGRYSYPTIAYRNATDAWLGVRAKWTNDVLPLAAFALANPGQRTDLDGVVRRHAGWATWVEAGPLPVACGKLSGQLLYASGGSGSGTGGEFRTIAQSYRDNFGSQGYWSYLHLTTPNAPGDVSDLGVGLQNRGLGLLTAQAKFELPLSKCLTSTTAAGYLQSAIRNPANGSRVMGTEVAEMFTFDFGGGLKLDTGAAVLFTGDFYRPAPGAAKEPVLWEAFSRLQLEF